MAMPRQNISQVLHQADRWTLAQIQTELDRFSQGDGADLDALHCRHVYLLLPDTEHSPELQYLLRQFRNSGRLDVLADRFDKIPVTGVGQSFEGYCMYGTSLFVALGLLRLTTRYYGRLRCGLFVTREQSSDSSTCAVFTDTEVCGSERLYC